MLMMVNQIIIIRSSYSGPASRKVSIESTGVSRRSSRTTNGSVSRKPSESASSSSNNPFVQAGGGSDKRQSSVVDMKGECGGDLNLETIRTL